MRMFTSGAVGILLPVLAACSDHCGVLTFRQQEANVFPPIRVQWLNYE